MNLKNFAKVLLLMVTLTACGPSYSSIDEKIQKHEFQQINENEKDQVAMLKYLSDEMDFIANHQDLSKSELSKEIKKEYPYGYNFLHYYGTKGLSDNAKREWDTFLQEQISKGRDRLYKCNPLFEPMVNNDRDITNREIPIIVEYVYQAMSSSDNSDFNFIDVIRNRSTNLESFYPNLAGAYKDGMRKYNNK